MALRVDTIRKRISIGLLSTAINKKYRDQIDACSRTWVKKAKENNIDVYFFAGHQPYKDLLINLPETKEDVDSTLDKQFKGLKWLLDHSPSDFYLFAGTDNYINIPNLLKELNNHDPTKDLYIGGHGSTRSIVYKSIYFHSGGAGFIISHPLLVKMFQIYTPELIKGLWTYICREMPILIRACDVTIGFILQQMGIQPTIIKNMYGCDFRGRVNSSSTPCANGCNNINLKDVITCHYVDPHMMTMLYEFYQINNRIKSEKSNGSKLDNWTIITDTDNMFIRSLNLNLIVYSDSLSESNDSGSDRIKIVVKKPSREQMIKDAIRSNPFQSEYFAFLDTSKMTLANNDYFIFEALKLFRKPVSCLYIDDPSMIGDFLTGHIKYLSKVFDADRTFKEVSLSNPELFEFYYGDPSEILINYGNFKFNAYTTLNRLIPKLLSDKQYLICYQAAKMLLDAYDDQRTYFELEDLARLIQNYYTSMYYLGKIDECWEVLKKYDDYFRYEGFEAIFNRSINYILNNTSFMANHIKEHCIKVETNDLNDKRINEYINQGYKVFVFGDHPNTIKSLPYQNPVIRHRTSPLNINYHLQPLSDKYYHHCSIRSDIYEHLPTLCKLASKCQSVLELGVRKIVSSWALLYGLSQNQEITNDGQQVYDSQKIHNPQENINEPQQVCNNQQTDSDQQVCDNQQTDNDQQVCDSQQIANDQKNNNEGEQLCDNQQIVNNGRRLIMCDLQQANCEEIYKIALENGINCQFHACNDLELEIDNIDLTFIDTWHIYGHLKRELAKFHLLTNKFIAMHDTTVDGVHGESIRMGWNIDQNAKESGYPKEEITKGLWPAIEEFLMQNDDWELVHRYTNNNGLTVLAKKEYVVEAKEVLGL